MTPPVPPMPPTKALKALRSTVPPLTARKPAGPARATGSPSLRVPELTMVPPVWVFAPERVSVPVPARVSARLPESRPA